MNARSGLSVLELLVSLALLALIAGGLASSLGLGIRLYDRAASLGPEAETVALRGQLRRWLMSATPPTRLMQFPPLFEGSGREFSFFTLTPTPFAPDAAALSITVGVIDGRLELRISPLDDLGDALSTDIRELAQGVRDPKFSYFDAEERVWQSDWENEARLPDLVRIEIAPGSALDWPEFTVRPRLGAQ